MAELADDEDPFGTVWYSSGVTLDLTASGEELAQAFMRLLDREQAFAKRGLTCDLKDAGQDCLHCPQATLDPDERRSQLCRLGKDQSTIEKAHDAKRDAKRAGVDELTALVEEAMELGELVGL